MRLTSQRTLRRRFGVGPVACVVAFGLLIAAGVGQQPAASKRYSSVTELQVTPTTAGASADGARAGLLQDIERVLKAEGFEVKADAVEVSGEKPAHGRQLRVVVRLFDDGQTGRVSPHSCRVSVEWFGSADTATPGGPESASAQLEAERVRGTVIGVILQPAAMAAEKAKRDGQVLLSIPAGSVPGGPEFFDRIVRRVAELNGKLGQEAAVVERRLENDLVLVFDVDKLFSKAPEGVPRANKPMPVRVTYTVDPPRGDESNLRVVVTDLTGGEIDKFPDYRRWATSGPLGLVMGGP